MSENTDPELAEVEATMKRVEILTHLLQARQEQIEKGYTPEHDAEHGLAHVLEVAASYQSGFGEYPTDGFIYGELVKASATLLAALELLYETKDN